jgi:hypothetical protein
VTVRALAAFTAVAALALLGCPEEKPAFDPSSDRTLKKLQEEQERLAKGGTPGGPPGARPPPVDPLAEAAAAQEPPRALDLPPNPIAKVGPLSLELRRVEVMQTLRTPRAAVSTADRFVRVFFTASTTRRAPLSLSQTQLVRGSDKAPVALDVQRLGQGSPLETAIEPGVQQDLVLFFEVPPAMIGPGLKIVLPEGEKAIELPLQ